MKIKIIFLLLSSSLFANEINFEDALKKTLTNNNELKAKKLDIETSKVNLQNAKGYELGTLTFNENIAKTNNALNAFGMKLMSREAQMSDFGFTSGSFGQIMTIMPSQEIGNIQPTALNYPEARTNFETKLTYEVPLFTGYKLQNAKTMSELQIKANEAKYKFDEKQLSLEVLKAYNGAVASKYFIDATKKAKETTNSFVYLASEMFKEGFATKIDVQQAEVYDMKINSNMIEAKNQYSLAIAYLKFLTNDHQITDVTDFKNITSSKEDMKALQDSAISNRDDLKWMERNTKTMETKVEFEKSGNYPMIGTHLEYGYNDNQLDNLRGNKDYYTLAVGLEYKIFDGFTTSSNIEKAKIEYAKTKHYLEHMKDGLKLNVEKAYLTKQAKASVLEEKLKAQTLATDILEKSKEMYQNQLMTMSDLLLQSANEQKARAESIMAKYEFTLASAELQLAIGQELN